MTFTVWVICQKIGKEVCHLLKWHTLSHRPRGNSLTEVFNMITSMTLDAKHVPQCKNQMNDEMNRSFSLLVIVLYFPKNNQ